MPAFAQQHRLVPLPWEDRQRLKTMSAGEIFEYGRDTYGIYYPKLAARYYQAAVEKGSNDARAHLGDFYIQGRGVWTDYGLGLSMMREAANSGEPRLMYMLATTITKRLHLHGKSFATEAASWLERASELGFVPAMALLAETGIDQPGWTQEGSNTYSTEFCDDAQIASYDDAPKVGHVEEVRAEARTKLHLAVKRRDAQAMSALGRIYMVGIGVEKDLRKAEELFANAAELGDDVASLRLALLYSEDSERQSEAYMLFKAMAENGHQLAMRRLFKIYTKGLGVTRDYYQAAYWKLREKELGCMVVSSLAPEHIIPLKQIMTKEGRFDGPIDSERSDAFEKAYAAYFDRLSK
ncbi:MAG: tetratricopeptide repeat protein [Pseudomonadota bacterium]